MVKINVPEYKKEKSHLYPKPYDTLQLEMEQSLEKVIRSAGKTMVLISGGVKVSDKELMQRVRMSLEAGATGLVFGRNLWQRPFEKTVEIAEKIKQTMKGFSG